MRKNWVLLLVVLLLFGGVISIGAGQAGRGASGPCDRACLQGFVDQYLDAWIARDPKRLPLTANAKYTENGQRLEFGDGSWNVATGKGKYRLWVPDTETGQVGVITTVMEDGADNGPNVASMLALRLKVVNRQISEAEALFVRPATGGGGARGAAPARGATAADGAAPARGGNAAGGAAPARGATAADGAAPARGATAADGAAPARGGNAAGGAAPARGGNVAGGAAPARGAAPATPLPPPAQRLETMGTPNPIFLQPIPPAERMSRADLIRVANMYFSGMQKNDGLGEYPFTSDCDRFENAGQTTNRETPPNQIRPDPKTATMYSAEWSCMEQFKSGLIHFVTRIRDRRYVAVDPEFGVVYSFAFFDHMAGKTRTYTHPDGRVITGGPTSPWTWEIAELFRIEKGKIRRIEAILVQSPYGQQSGWSTYEESMSDKARDIR